MRFQDGCEKYLTSNQLTVVTSEKIDVDEEHKVTIINVIPDKPVDSEKVWYNGVYFMQIFNKEDGFNRNEDHSGPKEGTKNHKDLEEKDGFNYKTALG